MKYILEMCSSRKNKIQKHEESSQYCRDTTKAGLNKKNFEKIYSYVIRNAQIPWSNG